MFNIKYLKNDLSAGIVVYLVALPLCLGIALASGAPLLAGLVTGIVGGMVVSIFSGSEVSVSGPAAGLTVIVAGGIAACGSYEAFLCAVVIAGLLQILMGSLRAGSLAGLFPNSVIAGMLTAIGIIIVMKQIPHGLGRDTDFLGDLDFFQIMDKEDSISSIFKAFVQFEPGVFLVFAASVLVLWLWSLNVIKNNRVLNAIPGPLIVVVGGVLANKFFALNYPELVISREAGHLVNIPVLTSASEIFSIINTPTIIWSKLPAILSVSITIAIVASIETLLCVEAGDKIDPEGRTSLPNKELRAQGIGNVVAGLLGGIPMTAVIVRTSANVYAGAKTRFSIFFHGFLLLASILVLATTLNEIPLASLAAILTFIGYKLVNPQQVKKYYTQGMDQLIPFVVTVLVIVFTDLLTGVFTGLVASVFFAVGRNYQSAVRYVTIHGQHKILFSRDVTFVNKVKLKKILAVIPEATKVEVDGTKARFIDHDILEILNDFKEKAANRGIEVTTQGFDTSHSAILRRKKLLKHVKTD